MVRLQQAALQDELAWPRLGYLCDRIGGRPGGVAGLRRGGAMGHGDAAGRRPCAGVARAGDGAALGARHRSRRDDGAVRAGASRCWRSGDRFPLPASRGWWWSRPGHLTSAPTCRARSCSSRPRFPRPPRPGSATGSSDGPAPEGVAAAGRHGAIAVLVASTPERSLSTPHTGQHALRGGGPRDPRGGSSRPRTPSW
ncbi:MAG: hypothetical protein MZV64_25160 [Ignavibacteriales bacterium]|nr:hypothetical protein [Ignavibacteriales bacterium]